jgi:hypothetical protein
MLTKLRHELPDLTVWQRGMCSNFRTLARAAMVCARLRFH